MAKAKTMFGINPALKRMARGDGTIVRQLRGVLRDAALFWHKRLLPGHFEPFAARRYPGDYTPRTPIYMAYKQIRGAERGPMRFSGKFRRQILSGKGRAQDARSQRGLKITYRLPYAPAANLWTGRQRNTNTRGRRKHVSRDVGRAIEEILGKGRNKRRPFWKRHAHNFERELQALNDGDYRSINKVMQAGVNKRVPAAVARAGRRIRKTAV